MTAALITVALAGCLLAGALPGDRALVLVRSWQRIRYATSWTELAVGVIGTPIVICFLTLTGMGSLVILLGGVVHIVGEAMSYTASNYLPTYFTRATPMRESKEDA